MSWASKYIADLKQGDGVAFRPRGNSMSGKIDSGQLCTLEPVGNGDSFIGLDEVGIGDVVLCTVNGRDYLHLVLSFRGRGSKLEFQIGNNRGHVNGWTRKIHGLCTKVED